MDTEPMSSGKLRNRARVDILHSNGPQHLKLHHVRDSTLAWTAFGPGATTQYGASAPLPAWGDFPIAGSVCLLVFLSILEPRRLP